MGDENSFSEWESVNDDYNSQKEIRISEQHDPTISAVVVDVPPRIILGASAEEFFSPNRNLQLQHQQASLSSSSIASSFVRDMGNLSIEDKANDENSTVSSYISVSRSVFLPSANESCSSWSNIIQSISNNRDQLGENLCAATQSNDKPKKVSLKSNFKVTSLSRQQSEICCPKCNFCFSLRPKKYSAKKCPNCGFLRKFSRFNDMSKQENTLDKVEQKIERNSLIESEKMSEQAMILTQEIETFARDFDSKGFKLFPTSDMKCRVTNFIHAMTTRVGGKLSMAYTFTSSDSPACDAIRTNGFEKNTSIAGLTGSVVVSSNMEAAWNAKHLNCPSKRPRMVLPRRIPYGLSRGWIVAIATGQDESSNYIKLRSGTGIYQILHHTQVLPLVNFDEQKMEVDDIRLLVNGFDDIFWNFFGYNMELVHDRCADAPSPKEKARPHEINATLESNLGNS